MQIQPKLLAQSANQLWVELWPMPVHCHQQKPFNAKMASRKSFLDVEASLAATLVSLLDGDSHF